jgi:hypothetical protein
MYWLMGKGLLMAFVALFFLAGGALKPAAFFAVVAAFCFLPAAIKGYNNHRSWGDIMGDPSPRCGVCNGSGMTGPGNICSSCNGAGRP